MAPSRSPKDWLVHGLTAPLRAVGRFQAWVATTVQKIPGWPEIDAAATQVTWPLRAVADWALVRIPLLRRYEWLFETERLAKYPPVMLAATLLFMAYRGLSTTRLGHIGTDSLIYPALAIVSGFNPFLGGVSALTFGAGDLVQKLLVNDIYGTPQDWFGHYFNLDYWGSIFGYALSYSAPLLMGVLPGLTSRLARQAVRVGLRKVFYKQAAAAADGARPPGDDLFYRLFARRRADGVTEWTRSAEPPGADWIAQGDAVTRAEADAFLDGIRTGEIRVDAVFPEAAATFQAEDIAVREPAQHFDTFRPATDEELEALGPKGGGERMFERTRERFQDTFRAATPDEIAELGPKGGGERIVERARERFQDTFRAATPDEIAELGPKGGGERIVERARERFQDTFRATTENVPTERTIVRETPSEIHYSDGTTAFVNRVTPPETAPPTVIRESGGQIDYSDGTTAFVHRVTPPETAPPTVIRESGGQIDYSDGTTAFVHRVTPPETAPPTVIRESGGQIDYSDGTTAFVHRVTPAQTTTPPTVIRESGGQIDYSDGTTAFVHRVTPPETAPPTVIRESGGQIDYSDGTTAFVDRRRAFERKAGDAEQTTTRETSYERKSSEEPKTIRETSYERKSSEEPKTIRETSYERKSSEEPKTIRETSYERKSGAEPKTIRETSYERKSGAEPKTIRETSYERKSGAEPKTIRETSYERKSGAEPTPFRETSYERKSGAEPETIVNREPLEDHTPRVPASGGARKSPPAINRGAAPPPGPSIPFTPEPAAAQPRRQQGPVAPNYKNPATIDALRGLRERGLLDDKDAWRSVPNLTPLETQILGHLRGRNMLGPGNEIGHQSLIDGGTPAVADPVRAYDEPEVNPSVDIPTPSARPSSSKPSTSKPSSSTQASGSKPPGGSAPPSPYGPAPDGQPTYPLAELIAAILAAAATSGVVMAALAPALEIISFYSRLNPDVSCYDLEKQILQALAPFVAVLGGFGGPLAELVGKPIHPDDGSAPATATVPPRDPARATPAGPGTSNPPARSEDEQAQIDNLRTRHAQQQHDIDQANQNLREIQERINNFTDEERRRFNDPKDSWGRDIRARIDQNNQQIKDARDGMKWTDDQLATLGATATGGNSGYGPVHRGGVGQDVDHDLKTQRFRDIEDKFEKIANHAAGEYGSARAMREVERMREKIFTDPANAEVNLDALDELRGKLRGEARARQGLQDVAAQNIDDAYANAITVLEVTRGAGRIAASVLTAPVSWTGALVNGGYAALNTWSDGGKAGDILWHTARGVVEPILWHGGMIVGSHGVRGLREGMKGVLDTTKATRWLNTPIGRQAVPPVVPNIGALRPGGPKPFTDPRRVMPEPGRIAERIKPGGPGQFVSSKVDPLDAGRIAKLQHLERGRALSKEAENLLPGARAAHHESKAAAEAARRAEQSAQQAAQTAARSGNPRDIARAELLERQAQSAADDAAKAAKRAEESAANYYDKANRAANARAAGQQPEAWDAARRNARAAQDSAERISSQAGAAEAQAGEAAQKARQLRRAALDAEEQAARLGDPREAVRARDLHKQAQSAVDDAAAARLQADRLKKVAEDSQQHAAKARQNWLEADPQRAFDLSKKAKRDLFVANAERNLAQSELNVARTAEERAAALNKLEAAEAELVKVQKDTAGPISRYAANKARAEAADAVAQREAAALEQDLRQKMGLVDDVGGQPVERMGLNQTAKARNAQDRTEMERAWGLEEKGRAEYTLQQQKLARLNNPSLPPIKPNVTRVVDPATGIEVAVDPSLVKNGVYQPRLSGNVKIGADGTRDFSAIRQYEGQGLKAEEGVEALWEGGGAPNGYYITGLSPQMSGRVPGSYIGLPIPGVRPHEALHGLTSQNWNGAGWNNADGGAFKGLDEGANEYFTRQYLEKTGYMGKANLKIDTNTMAYANEVRVAKALDDATAVGGKSALKDAMYNGDVDGLHQALGARMGYTDPGAAKAAGEQFMEELSARTNSGAFDSAQNLIANMQGNLKPWNHF